MLQLGRNATSAVRDQEIKPGATVSPAAIPLDEHCASLARAGVEMLWGGGSSDPYEQIPGELAAVIPMSRP